MKTIKRTKIVATIGPVSAKEPVLRKMVEAGLNVARLNFSHGDHEEHGRSLAVIRAVSRKTKTSDAAMRSR